MALDPSIILGIRPPQIEQPDPLSRIGKSLALKTLLLQGQETERGIEENQRLRALFAGGRPTAEQIYAVSPEKGMAYEKSLFERQKGEAAIRKDTAAAAKSEYDQHIDRLQRGAALFDLARDQQSYEGVIRLGIMQGIFDPKVVDHFPRQYSPQNVEALKAQGLTRAQQLADQRARETQAITMRGQDITAATAAAGRRTTERGQDLTDARARELAEAGKTSDAERVSAGYASRMAQSGAILDSLEKKGVGKPGYLESLYRAAGAETAANVSQGLDPDRQKYRQAQEDWVRAKLRKESGAVIAPDEMDREIRVYFPQIGDSAAVIAQKATSRKTAEKAMRQAAGRAPVDAGTQDSGWKDL